MLPQKLLTTRVRRLAKVSGLQGPIDDAFMDNFLCVRGTGEAWHPVIQNYAEDSLKRFQEEWSKYLRGDLPVKDDQDVTEEDIAGRHLILFGDPSSNSLLAQVLDGLPLSWTKEQIKLGDQTFQAAEHIPVLIYPSPLTTNLRYIVLNSGHTFHAPEFRGTNALLYPRLGDYAILRLAGHQTPVTAEVVRAGLFDDHWQVSEPHGKTSN